MAGDWIPIRHNLREVDEVIGIAERTTLTRDMVVALLARAWSWADAETVDGRFVCAKCAHLDAQVEHKGFAQAMIEVGWLRVDDANSDALIFPYFEDWMGESAKKRLKHAKLTRRRRAQAVRKPAHEMRTTGQDRTVKKKTTSSCGKPAASKPKAPDPRFKPMVLALESAVGECVTKSEHKRRSNAVKDLLDAGATPEEVLARAGRYRREWPTMTLTDCALVSNWSKFGPDGQFGQKPLIEQED